MLFSGDANTTLCAIGLLMSLFCDDFKVLILFLRIKIKVFAQRAYLSYFIWVDISVFAGDVGTDGCFEVSLSSFTSDSLACNGRSS